MEAISHRALGTQGSPSPPSGSAACRCRASTAKANDAESEELIQHAIDRGVDHLDTSDMYGWGHNEDVLGRRFKGRRDRVVLATKFGQTQQRRAAPMASTAVRHYVKRLRGEPEAAGRRRDRSLLPAPRRSDACRSRTPSARWPSWCSRARCATSACREARPGNHPPRPQGASDRGACRPSTRCSIATEAEETRQTTRELGIGFVAYSPLGRGFLTGAIKNSRGCRRPARRASAFPGREFRPQPRAGR